MKNLLDHLLFRTRCGICLILFSILSIACDSDDTPSQESLLPPITMTGENTFGCLIDGKFFRPRDGDTSISAGNRGLRILQSETYNFEIEVNDFKTSVARTFIIHLENFFIENEGNYQINTSNGLRRLDGNNNTYVHCIIDNNGVRKFYTSFDNSGIVSITKLDLDLTNGNIFSGIFAAKLTNTLNPLDTLVIERGRFDINSRTLSQTSFD